MAFEAGRHIIGYEVQKVLAAVDWFDTENAGRPSRSASRATAKAACSRCTPPALDTRIGAALVSGYFQPREELWKEPIYRDVWGLLREFGDAETGRPDRAARVDRGPAPGSPKSPARRPRPRAAGSRSRRSDRDSAARRRPRRSRPRPAASNPRVLTSGDPLATFCQRPRHSVPRHRRRATSRRPNFDPAARAPPPVRPARRPHAGPDPPLPADARSCRGQAHQPAMREHRLERGDRPPARSQRHPPTRARG